MAGWQGISWGAPDRQPLYGVAAGGWSYTDGDFEERGGGIYLAAPRTFGADGALSLPADGLIALNAANLASAVVSDGVLRLTSNAGTYTFTNATQTGPGLARARSADYANGFRLPSETRLFWFARLELVTYPNENDGVHLISYRDGGLADHVFGGILIGASNFYLTSDTGATTPINTGTGSSESGVVWVCNEITPDRVVNWSVYTDDATIPQSGWTQGATNAATFSAGEKVFTGFFLKANGAAVVGDVSHFSAWRAPLWETEPDALPLGQMEPLWAPTASLFSTAGPVASAQIQIPARETITDARIRAALTAASVWSPTNITARARRGAAPTGAYSSVATLTQEAGAGDDLYIDIKMTSDGYAPVGLRPLVL